MRKLLKWAGIALMGLLAGSQFIRPARTNPPTHSEESMEAYVQVPGDVASVLDRACRDCHSHETQWPWYSNTAPVSWFVIDHVNHGRKHLNFSDWNHTDRHLATLLTFCPPGPGARTKASSMSPSSRRMVGETRILRSGVDMSAA